MALPNQPGTQYTHNNNYSALASKGGDNDQVNGRFDYSVSDKLRLFGRFSRWHSTNLPFAPFHNGIYANDPYAPEEFTTSQGVLGRTYLITPTLVLDLRASYIRFPYIRSQSFENISLSKTFGFPAYMDQQLPIIHSGPGTSIPSVSVGGYTTASGLHILSTENDYLLTPNLSWVRGQAHLEIRRRLARHAERLLPDVRRRIVLLHRRRLRARTRSTAAPAATVSLPCCWGSAPAARRRLFPGRGSRCTIRDTMPRIPGRRHHRLTRDRRHPLGDPRRLA